MFRAGISCWAMQKQETQHSSNYFAFGLSSSAPLLAHPIFGSILLDVVVGQRLPPASCLPPEDQRLLVEDAPPCPGSWPARELPAMAGQGENAKWQRRVVKLDLLKWVPPVVASAEPQGDPHQQACNNKPP